MKKTAAQIAETILYKTAARRITKNTLKELYSLYARTEDTPMKFSDWLKSIRPSPEVLKVRKDPMYSTIESYLRGRPTSWVTAKASENPLLERMLLRVPIRPEEWGIAPTLRQRRSHLHGPKPGEYLIPSTTTPLAIALPERGSPRFIFRGNPIPKKPGFAYFMTRHPDIASHYTFEHPDVQDWREPTVFTKPTGKIFAYKAKPLEKFPELPARIYQPSLTAEEMHRLARSQIAAQTPTQKDLFLSKTNPVTVKQLAHMNPTYEKIIPGSMRPKYVGEYTARPSRLPSGAPAFAIRRVSGRPVREVFREFIGKMSPIFSHMR